MSKEQLRVKQKPVLSSEMRVVPLKMLSSHTKAKWHFLMHYTKREREEKNEVPQTKSSSKLVFPFLLRFCHHHQNFCSTNYCGHFPCCPWYFRVKERLKTSTLPIFSYSFYERAVTGNHFEYYVFSGGIYKSV